MKEWLTNKDNWLGILIAIFFGLLGMGTSFSFDVINLTLGTIGTSIGVSLGAAFKEWRRGRFEVRPKNWYIPYIIGWIIVELLTILTCVKLG